MDKNNKNSNRQPPLNPNKDNKPPKSSFNAYWIYTLIFIALLALYFFGGNSSVKEVSWSDFQKYVNEDRVESIVIYSNKEIAEAKVRSESVDYIFGESANAAGKNPVITVRIPSAEGASEFIDKVKSEKGYNIELRFDTTSEIWGILLTAAPFILLIVFWVWMMRRMQSGGGGGGGGNIFNVGKSKAQLFDKDAGVKVTFKDVAGLSEAKEEVKEIVEFLKHPDNYTNLGGKFQKGHY